MVHFSVVADAVNMAARQRQREWPGDPHAVWGATRGWCDMQSPPRPRLPDWRDADVFAQCVSPRHVTPTPWCTVAAGLFFAVCVWLQDGGLLDIVFAVGAVGLVTAGFYFMWWERYRHAHWMRRLHARALEYGVGGHAYRTEFTWHDGEGAPTATFLVVDERLPDHAALRLHRALTTWLDRVTADPQLNSRARQLFNRRWAVALVEIFGPEAAGGWLVLDQGDDDSPWRLLLDRPTRVEEYLHDEIMVIGAHPSGGKPSRGAANTTLEQ